MSNSNLITYSKISPNKNSPRNHAIDTLTIHCAAMDVNALTLATLFLDPERGASANYVIGKTVELFFAWTKGTGAGAAAIRKTTIVQSPSRLPATLLNLMA